MAEMGLSGSAQRMEEGALRRRVAKKLLSHDANSTESVSLRRLQIEVVKQSRNEQPLSVADLKARLSPSACEAIEYIEPDQLMYALAPPADPLAFLWGYENYGQDGGMSNVDVDGSLAQSLRSQLADVVVGVIDTGVDYTHPDLAGRIFVNPNEPRNGIDDDSNGYVDDDLGVNLACEEPFIFGSCNLQLPVSDVRDRHGHGTHVSGIIAAENVASRGIHGVAPNAKIMILRVLNAQGAGSFSDLVTAINYAIDQKLRGVNIRVLNASLGGELSCSSSMQNAITIADSYGITFVAATGNDSKNLDSRGVNFAPAECSGVISVAAVDRFGHLAYYSNYGAIAAHVAAPGTEIFSAFAKNASPYVPYRILTGTSMAAPHIAGVVAVLIGYRPSLTTLEIKNLLINTSKPLAGLVNKTASAGVVSLQGAIQGL
jgi:subtilisin family serine protease